MSRIVISCALLASAAIATRAAGQGNPFQAKYSGLPTLTITYSYTGDMTGSARSTTDGNRTANWSSYTARFLGKTSNDSSWGMTTPDTIWTADLGHKTGTVSVNPLPSMSKAWNGLDAESKARFQSNMKAMAQFVAQALPGVPLTGTPKETRTIAGESCELTDWGAFAFCTMKTAPVTLYSKGSLFCVNYEETATAVTHQADPSLFQVPSNIKWKQMLNRQQTDSMAQAWVRTLASKELADSIAKAQQKMQQEHQNGASSQTAAASSDTVQMSPEDQKKVCDKLRNFTLATALNDAWHSFLDESAKNAGRAAADKLFGHIIHD